MVLVASVDVLVAGNATAHAIVLDEPLSFWGGFDADTGVIIDVHHAQHGESLKDRVVVMAFAKGSSSTANTLAESIHRGTGPAAIVLAQPDEIVVLGAVVSGELYGDWRPVVVADAAVFGSIKNGQIVTVSAEGELTVAKAD